MGFYVVISWNPAEEPPFGWRVHVSQPLATKREAWNYVRRVQKRAKLSDVQLHDLAVFDKQPSNACGYDVDHDKRRVYDHALWRLHGRHRSYSRLFC